jgi:hypothetical protein
MPVTAWRMWYQSQPDWTLSSTQVLLTLQLSEERLMGMFCLPVLCLSTEIVPPSINGFANCILRHITRERLNGFPCNLVRRPVHTRTFLFPRIGNNNVTNVEACRERMIFHHDVITLYPVSQLMTSLSTMSFSESRTVDRTFTESGTEVIPMEATPNS